MKNAPAPLFAIDNHIHIIKIIGLNTISAMPDKKISIRRFKNFRYIIEKVNYIIDYIFLPLYLYQIVSHVLDKPVLLAYIYRDLHRVI